MINFRSFLCIILCFFQFHLRKCNTQVSILSNQPVKNCPENQCTVGIPINLRSPLNEFTFCGKYRFNFLKASFLMYMEGPDSFIMIRDFEENKGLVNFNGNNQFFSFQNQTLVPDDWYHICMAVTDYGITKLVLNGEFIYEALLKGASKNIETNLWLGGSNILNLNFLRLDGSMTDIYLWNKSLNIDDLMLITTGKKSSHSISAPALFSWKTFKITASCPCIEYRKIDGNDELFKDSFTEKEIILFEHKTTFDSANQFCKGFGGNFMVPQDSNEIGFVHSLIKKSDICQQPFVGLFKINATMLVDVNHTIAPFVHWNDYEPNGGEYEECISINLKSNNSFNDVNCFRRSCFVCLMTTKKIYSLRGEIPLNIERNYLVSMSGKETKIRGLTETECIWNNTWYFGSDLKQDTSVGSSLIPPMGLQSWNNVQILKFTQCKDKFTCHTQGYCISMMKRCNGHQDCSDGSDEANCTIMTLKDGYDKKYPSTLKNTTVSISMEIYDILDIQELVMEYTVYLKISMWWYDSRITFRNLKIDNNANILSAKEIDQIWSPELIFWDSNEVGIIRAGDQVSKDASKFSGKGTVKVLRHGNQQHNPLKEIDEDYLYPGKENPFLMTNRMVVKLGCKFSLETFPFDSQLCPIKLNKGMEQEPQFSLKWDKPPLMKSTIKLMQYNIKDLYFNNTNEIQNEITVNIKLQRKLSGHIFNIYIPTLCLVLIAWFTLFIDYSHFEATIMVALTTMLVIYTLHQSISATLPATAYLKMIDVWLFGGLIVPFIIIWILIILDYLVMKETNKVKDFQKKDENIWNPKYFIKVMRIIVSLAVGFSMGLYWIIGLTYYFN